MSVERCALHRVLIVDRRCPSCDLLDTLPDRHTLPVISDHADQATQPKEH